MMPRRLATRRPMRSRWLLICALAGAFWQTGKTADGCCRFATGAYTESAYFGDGLTIAVGRDKAALRNEINGALRDLETDGVLDELALRFLPMSLY